MQNTQKPWQIEVHGQIYEADLAELKQWITEGSVLPSDNVRRGDLRWLPAEKVPALSDVFIGSDIGFAMPPSVSNDRKLVSASSNNSTGSKINSIEKHLFDIAPVKTSDAEVEVDESFCSVHKNLPTAYACNICENYFCKNCPKSFGGSVRLCPLCGSLCREIDQSTDERVNKAIGAFYKPYSQIDEAELGESQNSKTRISGVMKFIAYPLKFSVSVVYVALNSFGTPRPEKPQTLSK